MKDWAENVSELIIVKETVTRKWSQYSVVGVFLPLVHGVKF